MKAFSIPLLLVALVFGGCSSLSYDSAYDETVDFATYSTFNFMESPEDATSYGSLLKQRIDRSIENEMTARGITKADNPDLYVVYHLNVERRITGATINNWGYGWGGWGYGGTVNYNEYEEGTVFLDIVDAEQKQVVWRGTVNGAVSGKEPSQEKIDEVVGKLLAPFPPEAGS
jgi:hypothetical protein